MAKERARRDSGQSTDSVQASVQGVGAGLEGAAKGGSDVAETISHFHYAPTAVALLPVLASLIVGSDLTDLTLLLLVAIYLHNCVTVPADYYKHSRRRYKSIDTANLSESQASALRKQRANELHAFFGLIVGPILGACLLHYVRTIMGRPTNGLISNFNITIFVLAAEIRPIKIAHEFLSSRSDHLHEELQDVPPSKYDALAHKFDDLLQDFSLLQQKVSSDDSSMRKNVSGIVTHASDDSGQLDAVKSAVRHFERQNHQEKKLLRAQLQELGARLDRLERRNLDLPTHNTPGSAFESIMTFPMRLFYRCWTILTFPFRLLHRSG
ncbi:hypothetical protein BCR37DRAFT_375672 [Protomyces lactucae-debilis]|uniref:Uncharacterized protein n=1 Tax=Protomyces lactucae-debilis TaxID=2754530 RepID=A0A1Y2FUU5_PROLT|nr:uncharacterized protein BCR37DRAFT_375672 [Protomyces lactucae-debilis]ORY87780.1 hypothetical protein BCR37DRAFT_375672 [Protomyces lactucae-debilis]